MGYFNEYIISQRYSRFFVKNGIRELITEKHREEGPWTTRSNKRNNSIDGIWGSPGISTTSFWYLPIHYTITLDHKLIWVKISLFCDRGQNPPVQRPLRTKTNTPSPVRSKKYTWITKNNILIIHQINIIFWFVEFSHLSSFIIF